MLTNPFLIILLSAVAAQGVPHKSSSLPEGFMILRNALKSEGRVAFEGRQTVVISDGDGTDATVTEEVNLGDGHSRTEYLLPRSAAGRLVVESGKTRWEYDPGQALAVRSTLSRRRRTSEDVDRVIESIKHNYRVRVDRRTYTSSGRPRYVIEILPLMNDRNRYLWWIDRATGLVFRRETFDRDGKLLWTSSYSALSFRPSKTTKDIAFVPPKNSRVIARKDTTQIDSHSETRSLAYAWGPIEPSIGKGFTFDLARPVTIKGLPGLHLQYSDGIVGISLIMVRGNATVPSEPESTKAVAVGSATGSITRESRFSVISWSATGRTYSLIGDVPEPMLLAIARTIR